ncbi:MAG: hypothetical protein HKN80_02925 [Acidimicrobiia bacterium]|nr:hypothetical protein [Acidimicrobiia bacterium]
MVAAIVLMSVLCAAISGQIARRKGLSVPLFVVLGLFLSWVGILLAVIARSRRGVPTSTTKDDIELDAAKRRILEGI